MPKEINVSITPESYEAARQADSGGCLIADYLKGQGFRNVHVDMATIRVTDGKKGQRYTYLTPPAAQRLLLSYDQGWGQPTDSFVLKRPVKITRIIDSETKAKARELRVAELEAKLEAGEELTPAEKGALTQMTKPRKRVRSQERSKVNSQGTVVGGKPLPVSDNPNLLRGRNRIFGAKEAEPAEVFKDAVAVATEDLTTEVERLRRLNAELLKTA